ncbi:zinc ABC transporter ATP-binding protein ZnuC [Thiofilum flexile]|uniref:zinc ABC transporter ATP-binding protein ZnuC n=1 Tax=Thiofilum flexile TaxID=125627 RepID=UPI00036C0CDF|nr:zinc ABC transporter ATP-binding protein ZnuC [Thiofilum flexile]
MSEQVLAALEHVSLRLNQRDILHDISLEVHPAKVLTLIGPNGAGKSSLLKILLGLEQPTVGKVWRKPGLSVGYVPQRFQLEPLMPLTVERFICLGSKPKQSVQSVLQAVGIEQLQQASLQGLSGGEMQRVLLARAILKRPELLVLDEPGQGVDVAGLSELYQLLTQLKNDYDYGVVLVSHDLHLVMAATDQVLCLNTHVCCSGRPDAVTAHPEYLKLFGLPNIEQNLAVYTHHHNHHHGLDGSVIIDSCEGHTHG